MALMIAHNVLAYLVGTPRGRLSKLEKQFLERPWGQVKQSVEVKLLPRRPFEKLLLQLAVSRTALGAGQTVCGSEAAASRGRTLHFGSQRGTSAEGTCHPPASAQTSVGLASGTARPGADARRVAAETGSGQSRGGPRLWSGRSASAEAGAAG